MTQVSMKDRLLAPIGGARAAVVATAVAEPGARPPLIGWYGDDEGHQRFWDGVRWSATITAPTVEVDHVEPHLIAV